MERSSSGGGDGRRTRATAHELARYEALFAARTRGMKSSAMREMMALTERTDVISLAGGLPDTSTFSPELYANLMARVASESTARALQYGPTEGMAATVGCIVEVMAAEGTVVDPSEVIVTTGGQQVIDLVCKTLIDPGDVIVAEAPTYPGAVPTFSAYQADVEQIEIDADGMPIDALESTLDRLAAEGRRPKFIYTIPNFQNPGGVTMSLGAPAAADRGRARARAADPRGQPVRAAALRGRGAADALLTGRAGGRTRRSLGPGDLPRDLLEDPLPGPAARLGRRAAAGAREAEPRQTGRRTCAHPRSRRRSSPPTSRSAARAANQPGASTCRRLRDLYGRRRDVMLEALAEHFGEGASWTRPAGRAVHLGDARRAHRHDRPARARTQEQGRRVRSRTGRLHGRAQRLLVDAPELRGSPGAGHPRGRAPDRHGDARAARAARIALAAQRDPRRARPPSPTPASRSRTSSSCPCATPRPTSAGAGTMSGRRVAVLKGGRSLERAVSLRSGAQVQDALLAPRTRGASRSTPARRWSADLLDAGADAAFVALHGRDGEDGTIQGLLEAIGLPYTGSGPAACARCTNKVLAKQLMREAGIPTPAFHTSPGDLDRRARRRRRARERSRPTSASRWSSSPRREAPRSA